MTTLLKMNNPVLKALKKNLPELQSKMIGRGSFSVVYPRCPSSVWKLTIDAHNYDLACSDLSSKSPHFSGVIEDKGIVGHIEGLPIYLFALERLNHCSKLHTVRHLVTDYIRRYQATKKLDQMTNNNDDYRGILLGMSKNPLHNKSMRKALSLLAGHISGKNCSLDLSNKANYMAKADGTVVLNDPLFDSVMLEEYMILLNPSSDDFDENYFD